jgi:hypothetical protein
MPIPQCSADLLVRLFEQSYSLPQPRATQGVIRDEFARTMAGHRQTLSSLNFWASNT